MGLFPKDIEILPPYDDHVFKAVYTAPGSEPALIYLSSAIIQRPVVSIVVRNNELVLDNTDEKAERFDINCKIDDDSQADIEMQGSRMREEADSDHANLRARSIFYVCDLHSSQSAKSKSYADLPRSYQVMFVNYTVFHNRPSFINSFSMRHDKDGGLLHNAVQTIFVELTKLKSILEKPIEQMDDMEKVAVFLKYADNPKYRDVVNRVIESKEGLAVAGEVLMDISKDERERAVFRSRKMFQNDRESDRVTAERIGERREREKWQGVVTDLRDTVADKDALIAKLQAQLGRNE